MCKIKLRKNWCEKILGRFYQKGEIYILLVDKMLKVFFTKHKIHYFKKHLRYDLIEEDQKSKL